jgi:splicing suppressor protein 51
VCATYQTQNTIEQFRHELFEDTGKASVIECTQKPHTKHKSLANSAGWYDYYSKISDKGYIEGNIMNDFSAISSAAAKRDAAMREFEERRRMFLLLATDTLTMPLTIVSALEELRLLNTSILKIHLLGATGREFLAMSSFEEILHLVPGVKSLDITAVGPSSLLYGPGSDIYAPKQDLPCCNACQSKRRTRPIASYQGLYHDFAKSRHYQKPDLIVAFNSGCVDGDDADTDWVKTLRFIVECDAPALFTTYNPREASHEQAKWKSLGAKFVLEPAKNKWSSLVPMPEFLDEEYDIFYQNYYRYVINGKV